MSVGLGHMAQAAEAAGAQSLWVGDHVIWMREHRSRYPYLPGGQAPNISPETPIHEALTSLAWLAASTTRVELGAAVLVLPQRDPLLVAKVAATIDALSGGAPRTRGRGWVAA